MSKCILNSDKIVKVKITNKSVCDKFKYLPYRKYFFGNRKEGFYRVDEDDSPMSFEDCRIDTDCYTKESIEKLSNKRIQYVVENNTVYYKSRIKIYLKNGKKVFKFFDDDESAKQWYNDNIYHLIKNPIEI